MKNKNKNKALAKGYDLLEAPAACFEYSGDHRGKACSQPFTTVLIAEPVPGPTDAIIKINKVRLTWFIGLN